MLKRLPNGTDYEDEEEYEEDEDDDAGDEDEDDECEDFDDEGEHDFSRWPAFIPWDSFL